MKKRLKSNKLHVYFLYISDNNSIFQGHMIRVMIVFVVLLNHKGLLEKHLSPIEHGYSLHNSCLHYKQNALGCNFTFIMSNTERDTSPPFERP